MRREIAAPLVAAFGSLAAAALLAACANEGAAPAEHVGTTAAASKAAPRSRHGLIRPPPVRSTGALHQQVRPFNGSYPSTGSCTSPLVYYGGPIIADPIVVQVSWNDPVASGTVPASVETYLQTWWPAILSPQAGYLAWLSEYDTAGKTGQDGMPGSNQVFGGSGTYWGLQRITPSAASQGATLTDAVIAAELVAQLDSGALPAPSYDAAGNCNTIYMIDFPPSVTSIALTFAGSTGYSCTDFCGYHAGTAYQGNYVYYGVMPDVTAACPACAPDGLQQDLGMLHSHELAEAMTDAQVAREPLTAASTDFMRPGGWDQWAVGCSEIGDSCAWPAQYGSAIPTVSYNGAQYYVQGLFDNARMDCEVSGATTAGCTTSATCTDPGQPVCKAGTCQAWALDADCSGNASGFACQPSGACGQCSATNATACAAPTPYCATAFGACVGCTSSAQCDGATPICDPFSLVCRGCQLGDCAAPTPVCSTSGATAGQCIGGCTSNGDCSGDAPVCDPTSHACRACVTNPDCATSTGHVCNIASGACVGCTQTSDCAVGVCDVTSNSCVQCSSDSECTNPAPVCDLGGTGGCRPCRSNAECSDNSSGHVCIAGACGQCETAADCKPDQTCDLGSHTCVNAPGDGGNPAGHDGGSTTGDGGSRPPGDAGWAGDGGSETGDEGGSGGGGGGGSSGGCSVAEATGTAAADARSTAGSLALLALALAAGRRRRGASPTYPRR